MPHQKTQASLFSTKFLHEHSKTYIHHPKYGLLQMLCKIDETQDLFASLYAKSLFFLVTGKDMDIEYQLIDSKEAKKLLQSCLLVVSQNHVCPD